MSVLGQMMAAVSGALSSHGGGQYDQATLGQASENPMQAVIDACADKSIKANTPLTYEAVARSGFTIFTEQGHSGHQLAETLMDVSHCDLRAMEINQAAFDFLNEACPETNGMMLNAVGANMAGTTFVPASTCQNVVFDNVAIGQNASLDGVRFSGFGKEAAHLELGECSMQNAVIEGVGASGARYMSLDLCGTNATGLNLAGSSFTTIVAQPGHTGQVATLAHMDGQGARALKLHVQGCEMSGANLSDASLAPDCLVINTNLIASDLSNVVASGLDVSGCNMIGANLEGTDIGSWNCQGTKLQEADLVGAMYNGQVIGTNVMPQEVIAQMGIVEAEPAACRPIIEAVENAKWYEHAKCSMAPATAARNSDMAAIAGGYVEPAGQAESIAAAIAQAQSAGLNLSGVCVAECSEGLATQTDMMAQANEIHMHRVEHEAPSRHV